MTPMYRLHIVTIISLICVVASVESVGEEELQKIEYFLTDRVHNNNLYLNFMALGERFQQIQADPEQKESKIARYMLQLKNLYLNSADKKKACSWSYFLDLQELKHLAKFKYNWTDPDPKLPRISLILSTIVREVAKKCAEPLKSVYKKKINSWLSNDSSLKIHIKLIDELMEQVKEDIEREDGKCQGDKCRLVERVHSKSNNDYLTLSMIVYGGMFNLGKKLGRPIGEWPKDGPHQVNMAELKKVFHEYQRDPCYEFTRYHSSHLDAMVDYAYIVGRADEQDNAGFYKDLDRYEFCELLI